MVQYISKDAVVAEIERRKKRNVLNEGAFEEDIDILSFLNTLEIKEVQEEPVSDDLEEEAERLSNIYAGEGSVDPKREGFAFHVGFKNGAKWQKEQMMKDVIDGEVGYWNLRGLSVNMKLPRYFAEDDKVKVIIIKSE